MTYLSAVTLLFASIGAWRIWNHEDLFQPVRARLSSYPWLKPIWCPSCNPFWVAAVILTVGVLAWDLLPVRIALAALAVYPFIRVIPWLESLAQPRVLAPAPVPQAKVARFPEAHAVLAPAAPPAPVKGCSTCAEKKQAMLAEAERVRAFKQRVVLLTLLGDFRPSYSLVSVILDQARMLAEGHPERLVVLYVQAGCDLSLLPPLPANIEVRAAVPPPRYKPDAYNENIAKDLSRAIFGLLVNLGDATVITHDLLFQAAFINHAAAIHLLAKVPAFGWLHVAHSCAGNSRPADPAALYRASLPEHHRLIALTHAEVPYLATYYATTPDRISVVPNARDLCDILQAGPAVRALVSACRLNEAYVVQVFPVSSTRMQAKGLPMVARILGHMERIGAASTRLLVVNAHANGPEGRAQIATVRAAARDAGLPDSNLAFTSEVLPATAADGLPQADVHALFAHSNLFIFPSVSEACPLVLAEAALAGCLLVTNSNVPNMAEIASHSDALTYPFGSQRETGSPVEVARVAVDALNALENQANRAKRNVIRRQSLVAVAPQLEAAVAAAVRPPHQVSANPA